MARAASASSGRAAGEAAGTREASAGAARSSGAAVANSFESADTRLYRQRASACSADQAIGRPSTLRGASAARRTGWEFDQMRLQGQPDRRWVVGLAGIALIVIIVVAAYLIFIQPG